MHCDFTTVIYGMFRIIQVAYANRFHTQINLSCFLLSRATLWIFLDLIQWNAILVDCIDTNILSTKQMRNHNVDNSLCN